MARERYLVGVSQEELEYKPSPLKPLTLKGKMKNIWYHYKWGILGGVFAVIVLTVLIVQTVTRKEADYYVCMGAATYVPDGVIAEMEKTLAAHGTDLNGDGEISVNIQCYNVSLEQGNTAGMVNRQSVISHIAARDMVIYMFDPAYYASLEEMMADGVTFFKPLDTEHESIGKDGTWFMWDVYDFAQKAFPDTDLTPYKEGLPTDLIVGVRALSDKSSEKEKTANEAAFAMLQRYLAAHTSF